MSSSSVPRAAATPKPLTVYRFEVRQLAEAGDSRAEAVRRAAERVNVFPSELRTARVYFVEADFGGADVERVLFELLTDPAKETGMLGVDPPRVGAEVLETHPLPGVMDPVAGTVSRAIAELLGAEAPRVVTGWRYDFEGMTREQLDRLARELVNPVVDSVHVEPWLPEGLPTAPTADQTLKHVTVTSLDDTQLERLSRAGHLFLSLDEMRAMRAYFRDAGREPTDIELETLAQTWSEHCVHKTLKSTVTYRPRVTRSDCGDDHAAARRALDNDIIDWSRVPNARINDDGTVTIPNLLKNTVAAATHELIAADEEDAAYPDGRKDWCLSVFVDNAGVIRFTDDVAVCVKVETHNHPSAIEPYGGAATGIGGVIRDIIGTGLAAKPVANTDVFCVASPDGWVAPGEVSVPSDADRAAGDGSVKTLPPGCIHPRKTLTRVIDGVRDYGNRMGIPTVNGAVFFDDRYVGNPLVFCGCVGVLPTELAGSHKPDDPVGKARPGDLIVALGGRTGRDGIHGATFSSAELTDTHTDEFSHAVQIGNAIEEKRLLDAVLRARDGGRREGGRNRRGDDAGGHASERSCLFTAITDCGAGGFSSAVGEMGERVGATVHLDRAPLKYAGLRYDEVWISESQERMVLAAPPENLDALQAICDEEHVELAVLGEFGLTDEAGQPELALYFEGAEVGRLSMSFLHDGVPMPTREAVWSGSGDATTRPSGSGVSREEGDRRTGGGGDFAARLLAALAHPNTASKRFIVRQYDHEVQGNTIVKPLVGPGGRGPGDAAVIQPDPTSNRGLAIACGMHVPLRDAGGPHVGDPYTSAIAAIDECVRNLVCVGADPDRIAILDNFCWPSCREPRNMGSLVRAAIGCYHGALMYRTPFISGKDSLNNQFRYTEPTTGEQRTIEIPPTLLITGVGVVPDIDRAVTMDLKPVFGSPLVRLRRSDSSGDDGFFRVCADLVASRAVLAAHDVSEGGSAVAAAEMLLAAGESTGLDLESADFDEPLGNILVQLDPAASTPELPASVEAVVLGHVTDSGTMSISTNGRRASIATADLRNSFESTFADW